MQDITTKETEREDIAYSNEEISLPSRLFGEITQKYGLGELLSPPIIEQNGNVNYNFVVNTGTGTYMVRLNSKEPNEDRLRRKNFEYEVTDHLHREEFQYRTPVFLRNNLGERLTKIDGKIADVYERLPGKSCDQVEGFSRLDLVKPLALYHRAVKDFSLMKKESPSKYDSRGWLGEQLKDIKEAVQDPQNDLDLLVRYNIDFIIEAYNEIRENSIPAPYTIAAHNDLHTGNVLQEDGNITGIIDFGNAEWGSKSRDLSKITKLSSDFTEIISVYRSYNDISDHEVDCILPEGIFGRIQGFNWVYKGMGKNTHKKESLMRNRIDGLRTALDIWKQRK